MDIMELGGCNVKLARDTITVKDDAGKTCGMVRGVIQFRDAPANVQTGHLKEVYNSGLLGTPCADINCLYTDGKSLFYLYDMGQDEMDTRRNMERSEVAKKRYEGRQAMLKSVAEKSNITVIRCHVV